MGMGGIIDFMFLASGAYLIGNALMAKKQGNITANVMLGKNMTEKDVEDKIGFIDYMYKRLLLAGVLIMAGALVHLANDYYYNSILLTCIGISLIFVALVIYMQAYRNGQKLYMKRWVEMREKEKEQEKLKKKNRTGQ